MSAQTVEQLTFDFHPQLPVIVTQDAGQLSSDPGLLPVAEFDRRWNYTARFADCIRDRHPLPEGQRHRRPLTRQDRLTMTRQRIFGMLAGYEDCNDHDTLRRDPVFKLVADRLPEDEDLASQPTLSRFENRVDIPSLWRLIDLLILTGIEHLRRTHQGQLPGDLVLDLDATDDPTHGQQQLALFHGYYEQHQYFPLIITEPTSKHVFAAMLRPGAIHASLGADDDLLRVVRALRQARADIRIHIRGDAGFGLPLMYDVCEQNQLTYTLGLASNSRLKEITRELLDQAVQQYEQTKQKQRLFMAFAYQAESWPYPRTVVAKAECHAQGTNLRFVVTNLPDVVTAQQAQQVYDDYIQRGESEHRMDELKNGLKADRLSCHRFLANFFRLLLHAAAFNLLNALRQDPSLPPVLRVGQPGTWRLHVIKVAAVVVQSARRVVVRLAGNWPWWGLYHAVGQRALSFAGGP